ncbi:MAG: ribonuclease HI [Elusimicrobia bacterium]|nr:ribonuclease HI [Elusimicrobiota bacterium]
MRPWIIYTDGACSGNPGPGGWAALTLSPEQNVQELGGFAHHTTNNRMEVTAAIEALRWVGAQGRPAPITIYSDSYYVVLGASKWKHAWKRRQWRNPEGDEIPNRDLWEELDRLMIGLGEASLSWRYVRGHSGSPGNDRCDQLAVSYARGKPLELYSGPAEAYPFELDAQQPSAAAPASGSKKISVRGPWYISYVEGKLERHQDWNSCRKRVWGRPNALYQKVYSEQQERELIRRWGIKRD